MYYVYVHCVLYLNVLIGIFFDEMATQTQTALRYETEKHNNASTSLFRLDKFEKFLDITESTNIVSSGA